MDFMVNYTTALLSLLLFSDLVFAKSIFDGAPCWVTNTSCITAKFAAVGLSKVSYAKHPQLANTQAYHDAISNLAMVSQSQVSASSSSNKISQNRPLNTIWQQTSFEQASISTKIELTGIKSMDKWLDKNNTLYVLVVVDSYNDINNNKALPRVRGAVLDVEANVYDGIIKSNINYATQLTKSIRTEIKSLTR